MSDDLDELEGVAENLDNSQKNNIKIRGLKEGIEREDLPDYLVELFLGYIGLDCEIVINILTAY